MSPRRRPRPGLSSPSGRGRRGGAGRGSGGRGAGASPRGADWDPVRALGHGYERAADGEWQVRPVSGQAASKAYRCPGCDQLITPGTPHLVTWPGNDPAGADAALAARRHWHRSCWSARDRRRPTGW